MGFGMRYAQGEGVEASRITLIPLEAQTKNHLSKYNEMDISLDPFPYAGTTTTCEALSMVRVLDIAICFSVRITRSDPDHARTQLFVWLVYLHSAAQWVRSEWLDSRLYCGMSGAQGVPCVTLRGKCHAHNVGVSLLTTLDMEDWIADDEDEYIRIAKEKSADLEALAGTRDTRILS